MNYSRTPIHIGMSFVFGFFLFCFFPKVRMGQTNGANMQQGGGQSSPGSLMGTQSGGFSYIAQTVEGFDSSGSTDNLAPNTVCVYVYVYVYFLFFFVAVGKPNGIMNRFLIVARNVFSLIVMLALSTITWYYL